MASPQVRQAEMAMASVNPLRLRCHAEAQRGSPGSLAQCLGGAASTIPGRYQILLWGDSHADHLAPGLSQLGRAQNFTFRQATKSGCSMTVLISRSSRIPGCLDFHQAALDEAAHQPDLRAVVVSARWSTTLPAMIRATGSQAAGVAKFHMVMAQLLRTIRGELGPKPRIVLVGSTPEFDFWPATCLARAYKLGTDAAHCRSAIAVDSRLSAIADKVLASLAQPGVSVVLPRAAFCTGDRCRTEAGETILFRDDDHLTNAGSLLVARAITNAVSWRPTARRGS